jgi:hypothetical protein
MSIIHLAERVDELVRFSPDEKEAHLLAVYGDDPAEINDATVVKALSHGDVYELLESPFATVTASMADLVAIVTCGWAAPITSDEDTSELAPSQHPERRRVRLVVCATREHTASVLRFSDDWDNPITDEGHARGSLADAVRSLFE